jgi:hypothetical protein
MNRIDFWGESRPAGVRMCVPTQDGWNAFGQHLPNAKRKVSYVKN